MPEVNLSNYVEEQPNVVMNEEPISGQSNITDSPIMADSSLSQDEYNDANKIAITIADKNTPIVVLFGPPACGKTMTLIRLTRYLKQHHYTIDPDRAFRPSHDKNYKDMCDNFDEIVNSENAADSTNNINFMLVKVYKDGKPLCQLLEGPGEYYFNPGNPRQPFPKYVNAIISSNNRKIFAVFVEPVSTNDRMDSAARNNYVDKIHKLKNKLSTHDNVLFVFNKIDETPFVRGQGQINTTEAMKNVADLYPGIFEPFKNNIPLVSMFKPFNYDFEVFHTGDFSVAADGTKTFEQGHDIFPQRLWNIILKRIHG